MSALIAPPARQEPPDRAILRVPPHSLEAEQNLLGSLMLDNDAFDRVGDLITDTDFFRYEHRLIYAAIAGLISSAKPADVITVFEQLRKTAGNEVESFGLAYINALAQGVPSAANVRAYATIIRERRLRREMIALADQVATLAFSDDGDVSEKLDAAAAGFSDLQESSVSRLPRSVSELVVEQLDRINDLADGKTPPGISTGIAELDAILDGGALPGQVITLAARPSVGKSSLANHVARSVAKAGHAVVFFSQEMPADQCARRSLAQEGGISMKRLKRGDLRDSEWAALTEATDALNALPLYYEDQPALTLGDIQGKVGAMRRLKPKLIILDFIQECAGDGIKGESRDREITKIVQGLKTIAKRMGAIVLILSQLNRAVEKRQDPEPQMSDLRESGSIEQGSDIVVFIWETADHGSYRAIGGSVAKNRDGERGKFSLTFEVWCQRWSAGAAQTAQHQTAAAGPDPADDV